MKRASCAFAVLVLFVSAWFACGPARAQGRSGERDEQFENEILDRLGARSPVAASAFQQATRAMDGGDLDSARAGFERVLELVPEFPDADRRLSYVLIGFEEYEAARGHAERAYTNDPGPINRAALALSLLHDDKLMSHLQALDHALAAASELPEDPWVQSVLLWAGVVNENRNVVRNAAEKMMELEPSFAPAYFYAGLIAAFDGDRKEARRLIQESARLGMPAEDVDAVLKELNSEPTVVTVGRTGLYSLGGWAIGMTALFLIGMLLSKITLKAAHRVGGAATFEISTGERWIRAVYRVVIATASIAFYASIPLLILTVIAVAIGILYLFLVIGILPIKFALIIGAFAVFTLVAVIRSIFARVADEDPGRPLTREEAPELWSLTEEVADRLDARPVETIYLTPGAEIAVLERGRVRQKLQGKGQRSMILGLAALSDLRQNEFMAILAHEYGHFVNRDTAGGNLANQVRLSIYHMAYGLAYNGLADWYNPAWLFIQGYYRVFQVVTLGASRLQEILADRYAAMAYGVRDFAGGLERIIRRQVEFDAQMSREMEKMEFTVHRLQNVYVLPPLTSEERKQDVEEKYQELMNRPISKYDSHPPPNERIALLEKLGLADRPNSRTGLVLDCFSDPEPLQIEMTECVQAQIDEYRATVIAQGGATEADRAQN